MFAFAQKTASTTALGIIGTVVGAAICLGAAAGPANAQPVSAQIADAPRAVQVSYGDLNLANKADQKRLDNRLRSAARTVCANGGASVAERTAQTICAREALKAVAPQRLAATLSPVG